MAQLKARLSEFLAAAKAGEEVLITDRGRPVARLVSVGGMAERSGRLQQLVRAGLAREPRKRLSARFWTLPRPQDPEGRSLEVLRTERESGW